MRYFISAGEPSGDLHAANLMARLRRRDPAAAFSGFGGDKMAAAGCDLLFPLAENPVIGLWAALASVPHFIGLLNRATTFLREQRPDVVVVIDYPGFHWHLARRAKQLGIPVCYYVPPQIWAWGSWRVRKMRQFTDRVLCTLPFEAAWFEQRGVAHARYVGHPFFDDLNDRAVDSGFIERQRARGGRIVALLPGSRTFEVKQNFAGMAAAARLIAKEFPDVRFLVAGFKEAHRPLLEKRLPGGRLPLEIHIGKTPEIIQLADASIAVSGSVSMELLYHTVPTVVVYRIGPLANAVFRPLLLKSPYMSLVNLMAGRTIYPEFLGFREQSVPAADVICGWLRNDEQRTRTIGMLAKLRRLYALPGASDAAADEIMHLAGFDRPARMAG